MSNRYRRKPLWILFGILAVLITNIAAYPKCQENKLLYASQTVLENVTTSPYSHQVYIHISLVYHLYKLGSIHPWRNSPDSMDLPQEGTWPKVIYLIQCTVPPVLSCESTFILAASLFLLLLQPLKGFSCSQYICSSSLTSPNTRTFGSLGMAILRNIVSAHLHKAGCSLVAQLQPHMLL